MKRFYYILVTLLATAVLSWVLPWLLSLCFPQNIADPFVSWSPINDRFIVSIPSENGHEDPEIFDYDPATDTSSGHYTRDQRDSLLPEMYVNQLASKGLMPDSLKGIEMSMQNIRRNRWVFASFPRDINRSVPTIYPLMESMPARFELEDPKVALTMHDGVEIIDMETNSTDDVKTRRFAKMFAEKGFRFPAKEAMANITTRKAYDNGYLIIDADNNLYHLKMQVGRPSMARIELPEGAKPVHVFVTENADRMLYGLVSCEDGSLYGLERDTYRMIKLPGVNFDPEHQRLTIIKSLFSWTIKNCRDKEIVWTALDAQNGNKLLGEYRYTYPTGARDKIEKWIFPFTTSFTSDTDLYVYPRVGNFSWHAIFLNALLAAIVAFRLRKRKTGCLVANVVLTLLFGIFIFVPILVIRHQ